MDKFKVAVDETYNNAVRVSSDSTCLEAVVFSNRNILYVAKTDGCYEIEIVPSELESLMNYCKKLLDSYFVQDVFGKW